jgi:hypothetical protein
VKTLVDLWSLKTELANGHPFSASFDIYNGTLDFITAATFGLEAKDSTTNAQLRVLSSTNNLKLTGNVDEPVEFPVSPRPPKFEAIITLTESMEASVKSPLPRLHHWFLLHLPHMRRAFAEKEALITDGLENGVQRFLVGDKTTRSALDNVLQRELTAAEKEKREPAYKSRAIYDEVC